MDSPNDQMASILKTSDQQVGLKNALERILADFQSETGTIHLLDANTQLLHLAAQIGLPPQMLDVVKTIPVGKGIAGQAVAQDKPVSICNLQTDASGAAKPGAKQSGVGGALCIPIRKGARIVGTVGIGTVRQHEYTPDEIRRLEDIAELIATHTGAN